VIAGRRVLAVVPARGGSKGVPLKNLQPVLGVPLVARVAPIVAAVPEIDRAVVSTDHEEIAKVAREAGLDVPFLRPPEISGDEIGDVDVLTHALEATEKLEGMAYDVVVMLQPTSPLRRPEHVAAALERLVAENLDAVWSVSPTDSSYHPLKQLRVEEGSLDYYDPRGAGIVARQQLETLYHRNGVAYAVTRECLMNQCTLKGRRTGAVVLEEPMVSIDTRRDFELVEFLLRQRRA
jgi:CMP-N-acetylneuraminic acid synthetase